MVSRILLTICLAGLSTGLFAQESAYYQLESLPIPEGIVLEVGGMCFLPDGKLAVCTRRGEVWIIQDPYATTADPSNFQRFAYGLHEPLGLAYRDGAIYATQRGELTRLKDENGDGKADLYETVYSWPLSGNYHDYSYGPLFLPNGNMLVALNLSWIGYGASLVKWRGWMLEITEEGQAMPYATGMRSPAGFGLNAKGDLFYSDNQGDWVGSGRITHVKKGSFVGNPQGLKWAGDEQSPVKELNFEMFEEDMGTLHEFAQQHAEAQAPAVWFPHGVMGISTSAILEDHTGGKFGPFAGQMFVGDQGQSKVMRMALEEVEGQYQGACFPFREGFASGVLRQAWGADGTLFVGMTNRGWASTGRAPFGIQRLKWNGRTPFEMHHIEARPDGFEIFFTQPVNNRLAQATNHYQIKGFTYHYHATYGSESIKVQDCPVREVRLSADGKSVYLKVDGLREGYAHEFQLNNLRSRQGQPLLHNTAYYTLNAIPGGGSSQSSGHSSSQASLDPNKYQPTLPDSWTNGPDHTLSLGTSPGMLYDKTELRVKAGSKVALTFNNNDDMQHNFVLLRNESAEKVGQAAIQLGIEGPNLAYIPKLSEVLYHTALLEPESTETIYFVAPDQPGTYPYVCTIPGHHMSMQGKLVVE